MEMLVFVRGAEYTNGVNDDDDDDDMNMMMPMLTTGMVMKMTVLMIEWGKHICIMHASK